MIGKAQKKIEGGKLVKIQATFGGKINDIKITGDFFLHPEEKISELEKSLIGISSNSSAEEIEKILSKIVEQHKISLLGLREKDIAETILEAVKNAE